MADARTIRHGAQVDLWAPELLLDVFHRIHSPSIGQDFAQRKRQDLPADERQNIAMPNHYRRVLRDNVAALFKAHGVNSKTARIVYVDGPKRGRVVSPRTLRYLAEVDGPGQSIDVIAAIAARFDLMAWQLLVPGLDPGNPPVMRLSDAERRLYDEFQRLRAELTKTPQ